MKAPEEARDLTGLLFRLRSQGIRGPRELPSHNTVGEAVQGVFPRQEHLKEHALVSRQGVERPDGPAVFGRCVGRQRVEIPHGGSGILDLAQGILCI